MKIFKGFGFGAIALAPFPIALVMQAYFARKLPVEDIGIFATINIFLAFILVITNWSGDKYIISNSKLERDQTNEVFTYEFSFALLIYAVFIIFFKETIAEILQLPESYILWLSFGLIFCYNALSRPKAILEKKLMYPEAHLPLLFANIFAGAIGIVAFLNGYGVWSMLIWKFSIYFLELSLLFFVSPQRLKFKFNFSNSLKFISFSRPVFLAGIIGFFILNADYFLVTSLLGTRDLGLYWMAFSVAMILIAFRDVVTKFLLPILAKLPSLEEKNLLFSKLNGFFQLGAVLIVIVVTFWSDYGFIYVFGRQWEESIPLFIVLVYAGLFKVMGGWTASLFFSVMNTKIQFNQTVLSGMTLFPIIYGAIKLGGLFGAAMGVLISQIIVTLYVFEAGVKKLSGFGVSYYFSYLTINIIFCALLYVIATQSPIDLGVIPRIYLSITSLAFAALTLWLSNLPDRLLSE